MMKYTIIYLALPIILLIVSCSSSNPLVKPSSSQVSNEMVPVIKNEPGRNASLSYPISDDPLKLSFSYYASMHFLESELYIFRDVYGHFPRSIQEYLDSPIPIFWPRNPVNGEPYRPSSTLLSDPGKEWIGAFNYVFENDNKIKIRYVGYAKKESQQSGVETYKIIDKSLEPFADKRLFVMGGKVGFDDLAMGDRIIYAQAGHLNSILNANTSNYYQRYSEVPTNLNEVLPNDLLFISENFNSFTNALMNSDMQFKWGFDGYTSYTTLEKNGQFLIEHSIRYNLKSMDRFNMDVTSLNKTNPILDNQNLASIEIPNDYVITKVAIMQ